MTKAEVTTAMDKAEDMKAWKLKDWASFNRTYAAHTVTVRIHEIDTLAYKTYMTAKGLNKTEAAGGHYATLSPKKGSPYLDTEGLYGELREMGVDIDALVTKYTRRREDTLTFKFI